MEVRSQKNSLQDKNNPKDFKFFLYGEQRPEVYPIGGI